MSYILDSIKKSDQERGTSPLDPPEHFKTPAYLKAPEPKKDYTPWIYGLFGVIIFAMLAYLIVVSLPQSPNQGSDLTTAPAVVSQPAATAVNQPSDIRLNKEETPNVEQAPASVDTIEEEPLAESAALSQSTQAIESLYETRQQQSPEPSIPNPAMTSSEARSQENEVNTVSNNVNTTSYVDEPAEVSIPSVFSFDPATQRTIPDVQYGAHIYASDNNSGFVILNGAKKKVGDQLRNGIYVEKINVEDVVLSYNGLLFTLPALKSWSYSNSP